MIFRVIVKLGAMEYLILQNGLNATRCSRCAGAASRHPLPSPVFGFRYLTQSGLTTCLYAAERTAKGDRPSQGRDALRPPFAPLHLAQHVSSSSRCPFPPSTPPLLIVRWSGVPPRSPVATLPVLPRLLCALARFLHHPS